MDVRQRADGRYEIRVEVDTERIKQVVYYINRDPAVVRAKARHLQHLIAKGNHDEIAHAVYWGE